MVDELDAMLQGSDDQSPASQAQIDGQGTDSGQATATEQQDPAEVEFNSLSGSAQDRYRKAWTENRQLKEEIERSRSQTYVPPAPPSPSNPDVQNAVKQLESVGIATDSKVDAKLDERFNALRWDMEQQRLESKYSGDKSEPQYVREEIEEFIRSHPQYEKTPAEDVYYIKFRDELMNSAAQKGSPRTGRTQTLKPTKAQSVQQGGIPNDRKELEDILGGPNGKQYYDDHFEEINRFAEDFTKQFAE